MSDDIPPEHVLLHPGIDSVLEGLSNRRRRLILVLLKDGAIESVADAAVRGRDNTGEVMLVHNHLPKLAKSGYVDWDRDTGEISKGPRFDEIEPLLDMIEAHADELPPGWP